MSFTISNINDIIINVRIFVTLCMYQKLDDKSYFYPRDDILYRLMKLYDMSFECLSYRRHIVQFLLWSSNCTYLRNIICNFNT